MTAPITTDNPSTFITTPVASLTLLPPCPLRGYTDCTAEEAAQLWRKSYGTEPSVVYQYTTPTIKIVTFYIPTDNRHDVSIMQDGERGE